jgi:hypothetical protein
MINDYDYPQTPALLALMAGWIDIEIGIWISRMRIVRLRSPQAQSQ